MKSKAYSYQFLAISMAALLYFSSAGLVIDLHFCTGKLKSFSVFGKAKSCHETGQGMIDCPFHKGMKIAIDKEDGSENNNCCSNKTLDLKTDQVQQIHSISDFISGTSSDQINFAATDFSLESVHIPTAYPDQARYKPPIISRDIYVLLESYLL